MNTGTELFTVPYGTQIQWTRDNTRIFVKSERSVTVYDARSREQIGALPNVISEHEVYSTLWWSPDDQLIAAWGSNSGDFVVNWDAKTLEVAYLFAAEDYGEVDDHYGHIRHVAWSPDGEHLLMSRRLRLDILNVETWQIEQTMARRELHLKLR
jgi:WD40 repeat protein